MSWAQRTRDLVDPASSASSTSAKLDPCVSGNNLLRLVQIRVIIQIIHKYDNRTLEHNNIRIRDAFKKKKIAEKDTLVHMGGRGVKIIPFF